MILHRRRITGLVIAVALLGSTASAQEYKAQQGGKIPLVGVLRPTSPTDPLTEAFRQGLRDLGYVEDGLVASLARPGGNITGFSPMALDLAGKRLELLREIVPSLRRMAIVCNPGRLGHAVQIS